MAIPPTGNPSVGYADSSPKKGAKMVRRKITGSPWLPLMRELSRKRLRER